MTSFKLSLILRKSIFCHYIPAFLLLTVTSGILLNRHTLSHSDSLSYRTIFSLRPTYFLSFLAIGQNFFLQKLLEGYVDQDTAQQVPVSLSNNARNTVSPRPFYAIAHRVLTVQGVSTALDHGANAMEMDVTPWRDGWWADHDGTPTSAGDTARIIFETIAKERKAGRTVTFVWLDIKSPEWCNPNDPKWRHCSIAGLRDLARELLEPVGVRVLYGFYSKAGDAFKFISGDLNHNEAVNFNGELTEVQEGFLHGPANTSRRVMSYGYFNLPFQFGNCREKRYYTCTELRQGVESAEFGKVFGWTSSGSRAKYVDKLLGEVGIDGLIFGHKVSYYRNDEESRAAARDIYHWLEDHKDRRYLATQQDAPW
ncbi:hypothetical protein CPB83DRAFT_860701 [Crepidotus variabilis]|uniref:Phospholipase D n=1 Tax=Crepidotus variabilis TaxID=179855 RepID=A0A9P6E977_9AGAR|nr:hypothetical protein CPB83DRAFT_860701 [Crepidotus variabilis]